MSGTSWGVAIAFDRKHRAARKWNSIRQRQHGPSRGLTGAALEQAVKGIAAMFPDNVIHEVAA